MSKDKNEENKHATPRVVAALENAKKLTTAVPPRTPSPALDVAVHQSDEVLSNTKTKTKTKPVRRDSLQLA